MDCLHQDALAFVKTFVKPLQGFLKDSLAGKNIVNFAND